MKITNIDVIVVTKNRYPQLVRCVNKILLNLLRPNNLIIVDSSNIISESSIKIINIKCNEKGVKIIYLRTVDNGVSYSRNVGIRKVCSEYFAFIDDDQYPPPTWLMNIADFFIKNKSYTVLIGPSKPINIKNYWNRIWEEIVKDNYNLESEVFFLNTGNSAYRTDFIRRNKLVFDERFTHSSEDRVFYYKLKLAKGKVYYSGDVWVKHDYRKTFLAFIKQWFNYGRSFQMFCMLYPGNENHTKRYDFKKTYHDLSKIFPFHVKTNLYLAPGVFFLNFFFLLGYSCSYLRIDKLFVKKYENYSLNNLL